MKTRSLRFVTSAHLSRFFVCCFTFLAFDLAQATSIIKGPYLQDVTQTGIVVMWETDVASGGQVDFGTTEVLDAQVQGAASVKIHEVPLPALNANTTYHYTVTSDNATSALGRFITAPDSSVPFRFAIYGDTRSNTSDHAAVVQAIIEHDPDFVLHVGDFVADGRIYSEWEPQYFTPAADMLSNVPLFTVLGNHEYSGTEQIWYYDFFAPPANGVTGFEEHWCAITYGSARFIGLNACDGGDSFLPGSAQYQWLLNELASAEFQNAHWRFVWMHNPPYTAVERDSALDQNLRTYLVPLFEQYGVDVVFSGDDHFYRHSLRNGIHYIITGGGGAPLHDVGTAMADATLIYAEKTLEHCIVDLTPNRLDFFASHNDGTVLDTFVLQNGPPAPNGLVAIPGDGLVTLTWNASAGATGYQVKRSTSSGGGYSPVGSPSEPTYSDRSVVNGTTFYYVVSALQGTLESANSVEASATPTCTLAAVPSGLQATPGDAKVVLRWSSAQGAVSYNVKRSTKRGGTYTTLDRGVLSETYTDESADNGTTYYYVVSALNRCSVESANSVRVSATPSAPPNAPAAPTNLTASTSKKVGQISLKWTASVGATSYQVYRSSSASGAYLPIGNASSTSYTDTGRTSGTTWYYKVTALNVGLESSFSNEAHAAAK